MAVDNKFRYSSYLLIVTTYILILLGAYVKAINAGLACPDWPLCYGKYIPDIKDHRIFAEWFHRLWAMCNGFLLLGITYAAFKQKAEHQIYSTLCSIMVVLYAVQIVFGGLTVLRDLQAAVVVTHLGNAILIIILQMTLAFLITIDYYYPNLRTETSQSN